MFQDIQKFWLSISFASAGIGKVKIQAEWQMAIQMVAADNGDLLATSHRSMIIFWSLVV